ncbi:hypothetical protein J7J23_02285, partial [bacterium]|nr:hypothetical protein [bacterium]
MAKAKEKQRNYFKRLLNSKKQYWKGFKFFLKNKAGKRIRLFKKAIKKEILRQIEEGQKKLTEICLKFKNFLRLWKRKTREINYGIFLFFKKIKFLAETEKNKLAGKFLEKKKKARKIILLKRKAIKKKIFERLEKIEKIESKIKNKIKAKPAFAFKKIPRKICLPLKRNWQKILAVVVLIAMIGSSFVFYKPEQARASTYDWVQEDWSGGADTSANASSTYLSGWTKYYSKDAGITTIGGQVSLNGGYDIFTEDFSTTDYEDTASTTADWDTASSTLHLQYVPDPQLPLRGSISSFAYARDVAVSGNYAYVADESGGVRIVDISSSTNPTLAATITDSTNAIGVAISGNYLYVADCVNGLKAYDITTPTSPSLLATYSGSSVEAYYGVAISGNYAYAANDDGGMDILDISNVESGTISFVANYSTNDGQVIAGITPATDTVQSGNGARSSDWTNIYTYDKTDGDAYDSANDFIFANDGNIYYDDGKDTHLAGATTENALGASDKPAGWASTTFYDATTTDGGWSSSTDWVGIDSDSSGTYTDGDITLAGTAPATSTSVTTTKPSGWTKMYFYDATGGGLWDSANDIIFIDDGNVYYDVGKDTAVAGTAPPENTLGAADGETSDWSELSYIDSSAGGLWDETSDTIFDDVDGSKTYGGIAHGIAVSGNYAYLADGHSGVHIINITTSTSPSLESIFDTGNAQQ